MNPMYQLMDGLTAYTVGTTGVLIYKPNNKMITELNSCTQQKPFWIKIRESSEN
jgi:hypothetical protein